MQKLLEEKAINQMLELESNHNSISIYNNTYKNKSLDIKETAMAYGRFISYYLDLKSYEIISFLGDIFYTTYLHSYFSNYLASNRSFQFKLFFIELLFQLLPTLIGQLQAKNKDNPDLNPLISGLEKNGVLQSKSSLIPPLLKKLFEQERASNSLLHLNNFLILVADISLKCSRPIFLYAKLLTSACFGVNALADTITSNAIQTFLNKTSDQIEPLKDKNKYFDTMEALRPCKLPLRTWEHSNFDAVALGIYKGFKIVLPTEESQAQAALYGDSSIYIKYGEVTLISGDSGSGKTTLANVLTGYSKSATSNYLADKNLENSEIHNISATALVTLPQTSWLEFITGQPGVKMETLEDIEKLKEILTSLKLDEFIGILDDQMTQPSNGQNKRMAIAGAMFNKARVIVLDETFSSVSDHKKDNGDISDAVSDRDGLMKIIHDYAKLANAAILCISHEEKITYKSKGKDINFADQIIRFTKATDTDGESKFKITREMIPTKSPSI